MNPRLRVLGFVVVLLLVAIVNCSPLKPGSISQNNALTTTSKPPASGQTTSIKPTVSQPLNVSRPPKPGEVCDPIEETSSTKPRNRSIPLGCRVPVPRKLVAEANGKKGRKSSVDISQLFREEVANYPDDEIRLALGKTSHEFKELYNVLNTPLDPNNNLTERVASRHNDDYNGDRETIREESVCRTVTRNIYPREGNRGEDNSLVYIPNNQEFMQVIQAELCQHPEDECSYLRDNLPYGMVSVCQQKYAYKKLMYLDPLEKRMASDLFRYPSCCACYVRHGSVDLRSSSSLSNSSENGRSPAINSLSSNLRPKLDKSIGGSDSQLGSSLLTGQRPQQDKDRPTSLLNTNPQLPARDWATLGANANDADDKTRSPEVATTSAAPTMASSAAGDLLVGEKPLAANQEQPAHHQQQRRRAKAQATTTILSDTEFSVEEADESHGGEPINANGKRINRNPASSMPAGGKVSSSTSAAPIKLPEPTMTATGSQGTTNTDASNNRLRKNQQQAQHHTIVLHEDKKYTPTN